MKFTQTDRDALAHAPSHQFLRDQRLILKLTNDMISGKMYRDFLSSMCKPLPYVRQLGTEVMACNFLPRDKIVSSAG